MRDEVRVTLNGKSTDIEKTDALVDVLRRLGVGIDATGVAVAVNEAVVPRSEWGSRRLATGDVVEVIRAAQGG